MRPDGARGDLAVWRAARKAIRIDPEPRLPQVVERLKALRPAHWLKNLLVFVPLFAAHRFYDVALLEKSLPAFEAFGLCASSGYLFNDPAYRGMKTGVAGARRSGTEHRSWMTTATPIITWDSVAPRLSNKRP
jgi:hypothetical protein